MVPFLYNDIFSLLQQILQTVVKPDLLINCKDFSDLMKLDLDKRNTFMKLKDMNIGFSTISTIMKLKETDQINNAQISSFHSCVIQFVSTIAKLFDKSPLFYNVRNSVIFDPLIMSQENVGILQSKLKKLLTHLMSLKLFKPQFCDKLMQEFLEFVGHEMELHSDVFQSFKRDKTSLGVFFFSYTDKVKYKELSSLVKMIFTLSHGQAAVECGFSINLLSKVNIFEQSLVCKKIVRDDLISN